MSAKAKKASKDKRLTEKRKRKAANKAKYEVLKRQGENTKSVRFRRNAKGRTNPGKGLHLIAHCGNPACTRCFIHDEKGVRARVAA